MQVRNEVQEGSGQHRQLQGKHLGINKWESDTRIIV
jgi:hypothetical protein